MAFDCPGPAERRVAMPRIHPRRQTCTLAKLEIQKAILDAWERHGLTEIEMLGIVNLVASEHVGHFARQQLRLERHGNTDHPADFE